MSYSRHTDDGPGKYNGGDRYRARVAEQNDTRHFSRGKGYVDSPKSGSSHRQYASPRHGDAAVRYNKYSSADTPVEEKRYANDRYRSNGSNGSSHPRSEYNSHRSALRPDDRRGGTHHSPLTGASKPDNPSEEQYEIVYLTEPYKSQKHHVSNFQINPSEELKRSYRIVYDPELSKHKEQGKIPKYKKNDGLSKSKDPRTHMTKYPIYQIHHKLSNKTLYRELKRTRFVHDDNSIGPPPDNELIIWGFSINTSESLIKNTLKVYGALGPSSMVVDPLTGAPLGIYRLKFYGSVDKSATLAKEVVKKIDRKLKLNGNTVRAVLNGHDDKALKDVIDSKLGEKRKQIKEKVVLSKPIPTGPKGPRGPVVSVKTVNKSLIEIGSNEVKALFNDSAKPSGSKIGSGTVLLKSITNHIKNMNDFPVPEDLSDYVKGRPFLFIAAQNPGVSVSGIKSYLHNYDYTRVLSDKTGFYVVFRCLKYANECFRSEFGKEVMIAGEGSRRSLLKLILQLVVAPEWEDRFTGSEIISDSREFLLNDFRLKLIKDVSDELNSTIMETLDPSNFPDAIAKLKEVAEKKRAALPAKTEAPTTYTYVNNTDIFSIERENKLPKLPSIKKSTWGNKRDREASTTKRLSRKSRFDMLPMSHALNYNSDDESKTVTPEETPAPESDSDDETPVEEVDNDKGAENVGSENDQLSSPAPKKSKLKLTTRADDEDINMDEGSSKPTTPETDEQIKLSFGLANAPARQSVESESDEEAPLHDDAKVDFSSIEPRYRPSTKLLVPVYNPLKDIFQTRDLVNLQSLIKDDEDLALAKKVFEGVTPSSQIQNFAYWAWKQRTSRLQEENFFRINTIQGNLANTEDHDESDLALSNITGSWKSEGFKKMPEIKKALYLPHKRRIHEPLNTVEHFAEDNVQQNTTSSNNSNNNGPNNNIQSSRVNRANNRRLVADIKSISEETDLLELNALTKRKKPVSFARSAIHNWGLYALEPISAGEMIIEYVGDRIRQQIAEVRERRYLKSGIGSSYLFRIDENTVIDATKKGGIARFINHSCSPSCTAKIIKVERKKRIVIYALKDIAANEELTYDYKFERETNNDERIPCLCGAPGCKGFLN